MNNHANFSCLDQDRQVVSKDENLKETWIRYAEEIILTHSEEKIGRIIYSKMEECTAHNSQFCVRRVERSRSTPFCKFELCRSLEIFC